MMRYSEGLYPYEETTCKPVSCNSSDYDWLNLFILVLRNKVVTGDFRLDAHACYPLAT